MLCIYITSKGRFYTSLWETTMNFLHALVIYIVEKKSSSTIIDKKEEIDEIFVKEKIYFQN